MDLWKGVSCLRFSEFNNKAIWHTKVILHVRVVFENVSPKVRNLQNVFKRLKSSQNLQAVQLLLRGGLKVDSQNSLGETSLHVACKHGVSVEILSELLQSMEEEHLNTQDNEG